MEYTKDLIFNVHYQKEAAKKLGWTSRTIRIIKRHKVVVGAILAVTVLMLVDVILMKSFMQLLNTIK
ncbi:MAG: hypothetical protein IJ777_00605 [Clostridia bacterium]|nr:hypothetical protein [Clostridia bacterium]